MVWMGATEYMDNLSFAVLDARSVTEVLPVNWGGG
jgi:hypothetical protein